MSRKLLALALFTVGIALVITPAEAQTSGTTAVSINLPSFVMLYYRSSISIVPSDATMAGLINEAANPADLGNINLTDFTDDALVDGDSSGYVALNSVTATISNFWAVRSLAPAGGTTQVGVAWSGGVSTLTNPDLDTMALSNLETQTGAGAWGATASFPPTGLGAVAATQGNVRFDVDLTAAATSGNYSGASIIVTAQNL